jgi:hypothetical protein
MEVELTYQAFKTFKNSPLPQQIHQNSHNLTSNNNKIVASRQMVKMVLNRGEQQQQSQQLPRIAANGSQMTMMLGMAGKGSTNLPL